MKSYNGKEKDVPEEVIAGRVRLAIGTFIVIVGLGVFAVQGREVPTPLLVFAGTCLGFERVLSAIPRGKSEDQEDKPGRGSDGAPSKKAPFDEGDPGFPNSSSHQRKRFRLRSACI